MFAGIGFTRCTLYVKWDEPRAMSYQSKTRTQLQSATAAMASTVRSSPVYTSRSEDSGGEKTDVRPLTVMALRLVATFRRALWLHVARMIRSMTMGNASPRPVRNCRRASKNIKAGKDRCYESQDGIA